MYNTEKSLRYLLGEMKEIDMTGFNNDVNNVFDHYTKSYRALNGELNGNNRFGLTLNSEFINPNITTTIYSNTTWYNVTPTIIKNEYSSLNKYGQSNDN